MTLLSNFALLSFFENQPADMSAVIYTLFIVGLIFCCIEVFTPGFGLFGGIGVVLAIIALILNIIFKGDMLVFLYMFLGALGVIGICVTIMIVLIKKGKMKSGIFNVESSVPTDRTEGTKDFSSYLGQVGTTENFLRPIGNVRFADGTIVDVVARASFVEQGCKVVVVSVEGQLVKVEQIIE